MTYIVSGGALTQQSADALRWERKQLRQMSALEWVSEWVEFNAPLDTI